MLFLFHFAATAYMTGLIWFVQVVPYPLFARVGGDFVSYQRAHMQQTTWVVGPPMLLEAFTAAALVMRRPSWLSAELVWVNLVLLGAIWVSTALLQVPAHDKLLSGFVGDAHATLVRTNWIRTALWTMRTAGLLLVLHRVMLRSIGEGIGMDSTRL